MRFQAEFGAVSVVAALSFLVATRHSFSPTNAQSATAGRKWLIFPKKTSDRVALLLEICDAHSNFREYPVGVHVDARTIPILLQVADHNRKTVETPSFNPRRGQPKASNTSAATTSLGCWHQLFGNQTLKLKPASPKPVGCGRSKKASAKDYRSVVKTRAQELEFGRALISTFQWSVWKHCLSRSRAFPLTDASELRS